MSLNRPLKECISLYRTDTKKYKFQYKYINYEIIGNMSDEDYLQYKNKEFEDKNIPLKHTHILKKDDTYEIISSISNTRPMTLKEFFDCLSDNVFGDWYSNCCPNELFFDNVTIV